MTVTLTDLQAQLAALQQQIPNMAPADQPAAKLQVLEIEAQMQGLALDDVATALAGVQLADLDSLKQQVAAAQQASVDQAKLTGFVNGGLSKLAGILGAVLATA
ncbi:hypothetical protein [Indioceanicola profundi]|uniref:hypothetical protein n=1 Tax=Indioceanicola profundi TaxID=2220096 RepID=UPI000E6A9857|nr:hypothetical protein [Indioceanicola profundi]